MSAPDQEQASTEMAAADTAAIMYLQQAVAEGREWQVALLEAIGLWESPEETRDGHVVRYLIDGEALDWLVLAERLCETVAGLIPEDDILGLLFHGRLAADISPEMFRGLIGSSRHHQYLNYFYGITVEDALFWAVRDEVRKERHVSGFTGEVDPSAEAYQRIYSTDRASLLHDFRRERRYPHLKSTSLLEMKEFTYWLFKYRLKHGDRARIASDTKKALEWLGRSGIHGYPGASGGNQPDG